MQGSSACNALIHKVQISWLSSSYLDSFWRMSCFFQKKLSLPESLLQFIVLQSTESWPGGQAGWVGGAGEWAGKWHCQGLLTDMLLLIQLKLQWLRPHLGELTHPNVCCVCGLRKNESLQERLLCISTHLVWLLAPDKPNWWNHSSLCSYHWAHMRT